jgi:hypothetical protein
VSWFAIRDVVASAAVGDPVPSGAVVAAATGRHTGPTGRPESSGPEPTAVPTVSLSPRERIPATGRPSGAPSRTPSGTGAETSRPPYGGGPRSTASYQGYALTGGQVTVAMDAHGASLVAAVPAPGFETQTWKTDYWFRVDFVGDERRSSLIVTWHDGPPRATVTEF